MKKKNIFSLLSLSLLLTSSFGLVSCGPDESTTSSSNQPSGDFTVEKTFSHKFLQADFNGSGYDTKEGSKEINGLTINYDKFTFLGQSSNGIQIGSSKQPQKTPWNLNINFNEDILIKSISLSGVNSTGTTVKIAGSSYEKESTMQNSEYQTYDFAEEFQTNYLTISLSTTAKAFYFDTLSFTCYVKADSSLNFTTDEGDAKPAVPGQNGVPNTKYEPTTKEEYYAGLDLTQTGDTLKNILNTKISEMTKYSYGDDTAIMLYTDADPKDGKYMHGIYDGDDILAIESGTWNKEHVWACSQMGLGGDFRPDSGTKNESSDLHNLRVSCQDSNGQHGNKFYDLTNTSNTFFPNIEGEANQAHDYDGDHRGDVARILFYMATRYTNLKLNDALDPNDDYSMGKLSVLLEWNEQDPVDEFEIQRNNRIYEYQGNRNPFIDYPELASKVFAA